MTGFCLASLAVLLTALQPPADSPAPTTPLSTGVEQFGRAYRAWNLNQLTEAAETLEEACRNTPKDAAAFHWLGVTRFHILLLKGGAGKAPLENREFGKLTDQARRALKMALRIDQNDAEAHALLGTLGGMDISRTPHKAIWLGPAVSRHMRTAAECGESNPRVRYLLGVALVKGADSRDETDRGLAYLQCAEQLFKSEAASSATSKWGREHCLVLIGQVHADQGDTSKAAAYYSKALKLNPEHGLARRCLKTLQEDGHEDE